MPKENEYHSDNLNEPEPGRSLPQNSPVEFDEAPLNEANHSKSYNLHMILVGLTLLVLLYLHSRRKDRAPQAPASHHRAHKNDISPTLPSDLSLYEWDEKAPEALSETASLPEPADDEENKNIPGQDDGMDNELTLGEVRQKARENGKVDVGHLIYILESTRDPYIHSRALYLLGKYRVREALPMIFKEMASPHPWVRIAAATALVKLKSNMVEERMIELADNHDPHVRATALLALSRIGTARSHEILRKSIWDFESNVRENAALAIGRLQILDANFDIKEAMTDFEIEVRDMAEWAYRRLNQRIQGQG